MKVLDPKYRIVSEGHYYVPMVRKRPWRRWAYFYPEGLEGNDEFRFGAETVEEAEEVILAARDGEGAEA